MATFNFRAPTSGRLPHIETMLNSIGSDVAAAKLLDVTVKTVKRYRREGQAPRAVMLALFWETPWGLSALDCIAQGEKLMALSQARILGDENAALKAQVAKLEKELQEPGQQAANASFLKVGNLY